jgi:hypothetical protein
MRVLLSSGLLAEKLNEIDLERESVERANLEDGDLILICQTQAVRIPVYVIDFKASVRQESRRWDWVKLLVNSVGDQPVSLQIFENIVNVTFQY